MGYARKIPDYVPDTGFYFDEENHKYYHDRRPMTGITTALDVLAKPALIQWSANLAAAAGYAMVAPPSFTEELESLKEANGGKVNAEVCKVLDAKYPEFKLARLAHRAKKEEAGQHGTDYHAMVETYVKGCINENDGMPRSHVDESPIKPFVDWTMLNVKQFLFSERKLHNLKLFIAGTADFGYIGTDGKRYMGDFKTSSGIYGMDYWLQVSAYRWMAEAEGDEPYEGLSVVRFGKDGSFEAVAMYEYEMFMKAFLACVTLYRTNQATNGLTVDIDAARQAEAVLTIN